MKMNVIVHSEEDFTKWKSEQETWLSQNPDYLKNVPAGLRESAMIKAGIPAEAGLKFMQGDFGTAVGSN
jgi:cytochrome c oxidase subunit 2